MRQRSWAWALLLAATFAFFGHTGVAGAVASAVGSPSRCEGLLGADARSALDTLVRLFLLQTPVARDEAERALPGLVDRLCNTGLLEQSVGEVAARLGRRAAAQLLRPGASAAGHPREGAPHRGD